MMLIVLLLMIMIVMIMIVMVDCGDDHDADCGDVHDAHHNENDRIVNNRFQSTCDGIRSYYALPSQVCL